MSIILNAQAESLYISHQEAQLNTADIPMIDIGNKSPTLNGMGYIFFTITPIGRSFLDNECTPEKCVLDIGAGYSDIPIEAIKRGVKEYVANDLSLEHLTILFRRASAKSSSKDLEKLKLLPGKAPKILQKLDNKFDAILADKVIHFLQPDEIKAFITLAKASLKKGGKIYVTTGSPYSKTYKSILGDYLERKKNGVAFPGHMINMMQRLNSEIVDKNYSQYVLPDQMILFSRDDLVQLFEDNGIRVIASYSLQIPNGDKAGWISCRDDESNVVGVIAVRD